MSSQYTSSVMLRTGVSGFVIGFFSWLIWLILSILSFTSALFGPPFPLTSGIYMYGYYSLLVNSLLTLSFLLVAVGFFGFKKKYGSDLSLACGIISIIVFAIRVYPLSNLYPTSTTSILFFTSTSAVTFLGILIWGVALLDIRRKLQSSTLGQLAGSLFIASAAFGLLLFQVIAYWGIEFWYLLFGWLYAAGAISATILTNRVAKASTITEPRSSAAP